MYSRRDVEGHAERIKLFCAGEGQVDKKICIQTQQDSVIDHLHLLFDH